MAFLGGHWFISIYICVNVTKEMVYTCLIHMSHYTSRKELCVIHEPSTAR